MNEAEPFSSLSDMLRAIPAPDEDITDGEPLLRPTGPGRFEMRGVGYLPVIDRIWATFRAAGFPEIGQASYLGWSERFLSGRKAARFTPDMVGAMRRSDCFNLLRFIERSERFCDGSWGTAYSEGLFHAVAGRLVALGALAGGEEWREVDPGSSPG